MSQNLSNPMVEIVKSEYICIAVTILLLNCSEKM